jgi:hypothetical protein
LAKHGHLAIKTGHSGTHQQTLQRNTGVTDQIPGVKIITAINHKIMSWNQIEDVVWLGKCCNGSSRRFWGQAPKNVRSSINFGLAQILWTKEHLPVQIGCLNAVPINQSQMAHTRGSQIESHGTSQTTSANDQDF